MSEVLPAASPRPASLPFRGRRIRLATIDDCAAEMQRIYREARSGALPLADACKLAFLLSTLSRMREVGDLERRVERLENEE